MKNRFRFLLVPLFLLTCAAVCAAAETALFPPDFPQEFQSKKLREKEVKQLAPGVTYYHYHFDNVLPDGVELYRLQRIFVFANGRTAPRGGKALSAEDAAKQDAEARAKIEAAAEKLKNKADFAALARELEGNPKARVELPFFRPGLKLLAPELEEAAVKLKKIGDISPVVRTKDGYYLLKLIGLRNQLPLSIYYVVIDWDKANVSLKLAQADLLLRPVKALVEDFHPLAATNGAYFKWKPVPSTYYPLKINGKMYLPTDGYDSHDGLAFSGSDFPKIDKLENFDKYENAIMGYYIWKDGKYSLDGKIDHWTGVGSGDTPLTSVGLNYEKRRLVLMTSDGRFPKDSPGLNFYSEGYFMSCMGCTDVLSIDGGGSCTMLIREDGKLSDPKNHPSDNRKFDHNGARSIQNCIYLIENK